MEEEGLKQLFTEFQGITTEEWEAKIQSDLKGADYRKKLIWRTDEGIEIKPFYRAEDIESHEYLGNAGMLRTPYSAPNGWNICQDFTTGNDYSGINSRIRAALQGGAQSIRIHLEDTPSSDIEMLGTLLEGIPLGETEIMFQGSLRGDLIYDLLTTLASDMGFGPDSLKGCLGADPLGKMATTGIVIASLENLGKLVRKATESSPGIRVIDVNGALFQNAGGTLVEELAFTLAMVNEYMALLTSRDIDPAVIAESMQISLATGSNYFMEVAKLRAARILLSRIFQEYGLEPSGRRALLHTTSSSWNLTLYDPYTNMLRGTTETMSAIIGGADTVSVLPFDHPYGKGNAFSDRIARNVQIILREEAYFDRVADPASGSYYIESLTHSISEASWNLFRETESKGGFRKAFETGWIQE